MIGEAAESALDLRLPSRIRELIENNYYYYYYYYYSRVGAGLTLEEVAKDSRFVPRCGAPVVADK